MAISQFLWAVLKFNGHLCKILVTYVKSSRSVDYKRISIERQPYFFMHKLASVMTYYWPFIKKYKRSISIPFLGFGIGIIFWKVLGPLLYRDLIDAFTNLQGYPDISSVLFHIALAISILVVSREVIFRISDHYLLKSQSKIISELYNFAFSNLVSHSYTFFANNFAGALVAKTKRFVRAFEHLFEHFVFSFWTNGVELVAIFIALFIMEPRIGLFFLGWSILYIFIVLIITNKIIPYDLKQAAQDSEVAARLADVITNMLNLKMFTSFKPEYSSFQDVTNREHEARFRAGKLHNFRSMVQSILIGVLEIGGLYLAIIFWLRGDISIGTIVIIQFYFWSIAAGVWSLGRSVSQFSQNLAESVEMVKIFEIKPDVLDAQQPELSKIKNGRIVFDNVSFSYKSGFSVFKNFSLIIESGETVGLVGLSGAGKSTITKLLLRFADVSSGAITIDGQNIASITQDDLRKSIAYVPQDPILFHRSLEENIRYGKPEANEDEIVEASKKAHAHEFINALPHGYATFVGERGIKLSGGERQRIAIARAMLKNAPILVLDEATSSLDTISEKYIKEAFEELMRDRTTLVIAHRLSTIKKMKRIIVLDKGEIIEDGNHEELLAKQGFYYKLWTEQAFY